MPSSSRPKCNRQPLQAQARPHKSITIHQWWATTTTNKSNLPRELTLGRWRRRRSWRGRRWCTWSRSRPSRADAARAWWPQRRPRTDYQPRRLVGRNCRAPSGPAGRACRGSLSTWRPRTGPAASSSSARPRRRPGSAAPGAAPPGALLSATSAISERGNAVNIFDANTEN